MKSNEILGVQTVRNSTMAGSFFASSSLLVSYGILSSYVDDGPPSDVSLFDVKCIILGVLFFLGFLAFALSVRNLNHLSFLMCLKPSDATSLLPQEGVGNETIRDEDADLERGDHRDEQRHAFGMAIFSRTERLQAMRSVLEAAVKTVNQGTVSFALGMRFFYIALPVGLWLFGTPGLIIGTAALIVMLIPLDYTFFKRSSD